jgi:lysozyme family protein
MAIFETYYPKLIAHEGGYVNDSLDRGGETYRGISRKNFPNWIGWKIIDNVKPIKKNTVFPQLENEVRLFYKNTFWNAIKADQIKNQSVAEILVDWKINGGFNPRKIQQIVGEKQDGKFGPITIQAINRADSSRLFSVIKELRKAHYTQIIQNDSSQSRFSKGWFSRIESFEYTPTIAIGLGAIVMIGWILYLISDSKSLV